MTNIQSDDGAIDLDDTDLSMDRENHQLGIDTFSGTIDCLGRAAEIEKGADGNFSLSGTVVKDFGLVRVMNVGYGQPVKGQATVRYTLAATAEAAGA
jgi:hypothetical protein